MGRIQATNGIFSGVPIVDTVDQLMKIQARPRDLLISRSKDLQARQVAVTGLMASLIPIQLAARNLGKVQTFQQKSVQSSNPSLLTAVVNGSPANGSYRFTPVRQVTAQQLLSTGFASGSDPLGEGEFSFGFGGYVDRGISLGELNGGAGVSRGKIRITDRSGASAVVDLRFAQTVDDVLDAINTTDAIQVAAVAEGDRIKLLDKSGGSSSNLKVAEVSGGSTAADLGLSGIDVAATFATGTDVLKLYSGLNLNRLNDGNGLSIRGEVADLNVTLRDGTSLSLDFHRKARLAGLATTTTTGDPDAQIKFTAKTTGGDADDVRIVFVDDSGVTQGNETVVYDDSDADNKTLTFHIDAGATTADDVIDALTTDATAGALFSAARATGSDGSGVVTVTDTGVTTGGAALAAKNEQTLGELLETINQADPHRLSAALSADGDRIVLTDLSNDHGGTFAVASTAGGSLAADLGLSGAAAGATLSGDRLAGGLKTTLLRTLGGGSGLGTLGELDITDRSGATATVNLSSAETLDDVIQAINDLTIGVEARVNSARNGLEIIDTTGAVASNFKIVNGDATNTADKLNIAADAAQTKVNSGSLHRQTVSENTVLSSLNGGQGVDRKSFFISDSSGATGVVRLDTNEGIQTVGDVIDAINALSVGVEARLNETGDGILIVDTAGGSGQPNVRDVGSGTAAKDLHLTGAAKEATIDSVTRKVVDGSTAIRVTVSETDTLEDVVEQINDLAGGFTASLINDGSGLSPFRLSIQSTIPGQAGSLLVDSTYGVAFEELVAGHDALLQLGAGDANSAGILLTSTTNTFKSAVPGIDVTLTGASTDPVTVNVSDNGNAVVSAVQLFVDQYNKMRDKLTSLSFYNETDQTSGALFGSVEALRIDAELSSLISGRFFGVGDIKALKELGIDLTDAGKLTFDSAKLNQALATNPESVTKFFTTEKIGFGAKMDDLIEDFAGINNSLLVSRAKSLQDRIDGYNERVDFWNARLALSREAMLKKFYAMDAAIGKLQNNLSAINSIQALPPLYASQG